MTNEQQQKKELAEYIVGTRISWFSATVTSDVDERRNILEQINKKLDNLKRNSQDDTLVESKTHKGVKTATETIKTLNGKIYDVIISFIKYDTEIILLYVDIWKHTTETLVADYFITIDKKDSSYESKCPSCNKDCKYSNDCTFERTDTANEFTEDGKLFQSFISTTCVGKKPFNEKIIREKILDAFKIKSSQDIKKKQGGGTSKLSIKDRKKWNH
jgi:hypothetical protein